MKNIYVYGPQASGKTRHAQVIAEHFGLSKIYDDWYGGTLPEQYKEDTLVLTNRADLVTMVSPRQWFELEKVLYNIHYTDQKTASELPTMPPVSAKTPKLIKITLTAEFTVAIDESNEAYPVELSQDVRSTLICKEFGEFVQEAKLSVGATGGNTMMVIENADNDV